MDNQKYVAMARKHWKEWLPQKVAQLKADGDLESTLQVASRQCAEEVANLRAQGYQEHEAEEVALPMFILLKPEPKARETPAQRKEGAKMEAEYQRLMTEPPTSPDHTDPRQVASGTEAGAEPKTFWGRTREELRAETRKQAEGWKPNERQREAMRKAREAAKKP